MRKLMMDKGKKTGNVTTKKKDLFSKKTGNVCRFQAARGGAKTGNMMWQERRVEKVSEGIGIAN